VFFLYFNSFFSFLFFLLCKMCLLVPLPDLKSRKTLLQKFIGHVQYNLSDLEFTRIVEKTELYPVNFISTHSFPQFFLFTLIFCSYSGADLYKRGSHSHSPWARKEYLFPPFFLVNILCFLVWSAFGSGFFQTTECLLRLLAVQGLTAGLMYFLFNFDCANEKFTMLWEGAEPCGQTLHSK
jgi:hypothetical protein